MLVGLSCNGERLRFSLFVLEVWDRPNALYSAGEAGGREAEPLAKSVIHCFLILIAKIAELSETPELPWVM